MSYKGVIFDLDGTLLNTLEDLGTSLNHVLEGEGYPTHSMEAYRQFVGDGVEKLVVRALPQDKRNSEVVHKCLEAYKKEYGCHWNIKTKPYQGIEELLNELTIRKIKMAVLSNKPHKYTMMCVSELLPNWSFDPICGQRQMVPQKPNPTGALEIATRLDISPNECIFLGDTDVDIKTAIAAGMFPVGALWGFRSEHELHESGAKALIQSPVDLLRIIDR